MSTVTTAWQEVQEDAVHSLCHGIISQSQHFCLSVKVLSYNTHPQETCGQGKSVTRSIPLSPSIRHIKIDIFTDDKLPASTASTVHSGEIFHLPMLQSQYLSKACQTPKRINARHSAMAHRWCPVLKSESYTI